jgi:hypothetical protein
MNITETRYVIRLRPTCGNRRTEQGRHCRRHAAQPDDQEVTKIVGSGTELSGTVAANSTVKAKPEHADTRRPESSFPHNIRQV